MPDAASKFTSLDIALVVLGAAVVIAVIAGVAQRMLVRTGRREPLIIRLINRASDRVIDVIKRPITVAVLDEVAEVLQTGQYTRNISEALSAHDDEIKQMVTEKIKQDPTIGLIGIVPFHDRIIEATAEATLRVVLQVLADPRTDQLVSDMIKDNVTQIRSAVRERDDRAKRAIVRK